MCRCFGFARLAGAILLPFLEFCELQCASTATCIEHQHSMASQARSYPLTPTRDKYRSCRPRVAVHKSANDSETRTLTRAIKITSDASLILIVFQQSSIPNHPTLAFRAPSRHFPLPNFHLFSGTLSSTALNARFLWGFLATVFPPRRVMFSIAPYTMLSRWVDAELEPVHTQAQWHLHSSTTTFSKLDPQYLRSTSSERSIQRSGIPVPFSPVLDSLVLTPSFLLSCGAPRSLESLF